MSRHLTSAELAAYRAARTEMPDPQQLLRLDRHLAECAECASRLTAATVSVLPPELAEAEDLHPSYEQLCAYIDGAREQRGHIDRHLKLCRSCAAEVNDLREFDHAMAPAPAAVKAAAPAPSERLFSERSFWARFFDLSFRPSLGIASAALLLIGVALITRIQFLNPADIAARTVQPGAGSGAGGIAPGSDIQLYFGLAAAVVGLIGLIYRQRK